MGGTYCVQELQGERRIRRWEVRTVYRSCRMNCRWKGGLGDGRYVLFTRTAGGTAGGEEDQEMGGTYCVQELQGERRIRRWEVRTVYRNCRGRGGSGDGRYVLCTGTAGGEEDQEMGGTYCVQELQGERRIRRWEVRTVYRNCRGRGGSGDGRYVLCTGTAGGEEDQEMGGTYCVQELQDELQVERRIRRREVRTVYKNCRRNCRGRRGSGDGRYVLCTGTAGGEEDQEMGGTYCVQELQGERRIRRWEVRTVYRNCRGRGGSGDGRYVLCTGAAG